MCFREQESEVLLVLRYRSTKQIKIKKNSGGKLKKSIASAATYATA